MKSKFLPLCALALAALTACNNDENSSTGPTPPLAVSFKAAIGTRAYDTTWEPNDKIGILTSLSGKYNLGYETKAGDGNFTAVTEAAKVYFEEGRTVYFTAYYPWDENARVGNNIIIHKDIRLQAQQKQFDFLYAFSSGFKQSPQVRLEFEHLMTKLVLKVRKGEGVSFDEVKAAVLSLQGFFNECEFNLGLVAPKNIYTKGTLCPDYMFAGNSDNEDYNAPQTVNDADEILTFTFILAPQEFEAKPVVAATLPDGQALRAEIDFTDANSKAGDVFPENEWVAGRQYNLSVTLNKTSLQVGDCTIEDWTSVDAGNVDAN